MRKCLVCENAIKPFLSFGPMPLANHLPMPKDFSNEYRCELEVGFCEKCCMVQLTKLVDQDKLYNEKYAFFSGTSKSMAKHFAKFADFIREKYLSENPFVVEVGSNDGILLKHFAAQQIPHLGIEPSANVAKAAQKRGVDTMVEFFNEATAQTVQQQHGQADAILGANVICHIPDIHSVGRGVASLLKPKGVFVFEAPYIANTLRKTAYDQIYDEHPFFFGLHSVANCFKRHGLELVDAVEVNVHGGSIRYVLAREGAYPVSDKVKALLAQEKAEGLDQQVTYQKFAERVAKSREQLAQLIKGLSEQGKKVVGYAATAKSSTVINYCGLTHQHIRYISDNTPVKQGRYSPGAHIPIKPHEIFKQDNPDYAVLFAWNHANEIMAKEKNFVKRGGKWIIFVPEVAIVDHVEQ